MTRGIEIIVGPMNSGKTTELIRVLNREKIVGRKVACFKPAVDNRESEQTVVSKDGTKIKALVVKDSSDLKIQVETLKKKSGEEWVIGIDEAQFFDQELPRAVNYITRDLDIQVVVAGLQRDFRGEPFGPMPIIMAMAQRIQCLTAVCTFKDNGQICGQPATETYRQIESQPADYNDPVILIGDKEEGYEARCIEHHPVPNTPPSISYPVNKFYTNDKDE